MGRSRNLAAAPAAHKGGRVAAAEPIAQAVGGVSAART